MACSTLWSLAHLAAVGGVLVALSTDAMARGGGGGAFSHGGGIASGEGRGVGTPGYRPFGGARNGGRRFGRSYGAFGGYPIVAGAAYGDAPGYPAPTPPSVPSQITTTSVVIHRGPAFGEPGYYSQGVIYRLVPEPVIRPGTRRFRVERLRF